MNKELLQVLQDYVQEHPEAFERAAIDIDTLINEFMESYDREVEKIKQDIINDPTPLTNPEQAMLARIKQSQENLYSAFVMKLEQVTPLSPNL